MDDVDRQAEEWLKANDGKLKAITRAKRAGEDALQEGRLAVLLAFRRGNLDPEKGTLDAYMGRVFRNAVTELQTGDVRPSGSERYGASRGGDLLDVGMSLRIEGFVNDAGEEGGWPEPAVEDDGYAEVDTEALVASLRAELDAGVPVQEAALKHGLKPARGPRVAGVYWNARERRWKVGIRHGGARYVGGPFRSLRQAEEWAAAKYAELGVKDTAPLHVRAKRRCTEAGCEREHHAKGLCTMHHSRAYKAARRAALAAA